MVPDIPICVLIFIINDGFSYGALIRRDVEKAHEESPTCCGLLNGVHSVRHYIASHLLFLTSILNDNYISLPIKAEDIKKTHISIRHTKWRDRHFSHGV